MHRKFIFVLFLPVYLLGVGVLEPDDNGFTPWFTGPLLAPSGNVVQDGHYNIQPYIYATNTGSYYGNDWRSTKTGLSRWIVNPEVDIQIGLASWIDCQIAPSFQYSHVPGAGKWVINDLPIQLDIQLLSGSGWVPSIRTSIIETIPIGPYRNLNPRKYRTDLGGQGSWNTSFQLVFGNLIQLSGIYYANLRLGLVGSLPAPVHVKGFHVYGGGVGTNGTVYPGKGFGFDFGFELTLSRNWAFACDVVGNWTFSGSFKGNPGLVFNGQTPKNSAPASVVYSIAPAIEYNWSDSLGVIGGWWGSFSGKNTAQFSSFVFSVNYYK